MKPAKAKSQRAPASPVGTARKPKPAKAVATSAGTPKNSRLKIQIDFPGGARLGPGKVDLLELIHREGSLSRAAEAMGISYRRAWLFMSQINKAFDEVAVATPEHGHGGGPARLTPFGQELIRHYRSIEAETTKASAEIVRWLDDHRTKRVS
ncbi:MAG: LysR family transcriptional regulator [Hyphomicrobium sp.]|nr:LysR family transcriptional regulator [Hyphomicrobium sp.]